MIPTDPLRDQLRRKLGETIPEGGSAGDTMFSEKQIDGMLESAATLDHAILDGWEDKVAHWAGLVNTSDGAASRAFSDLLKNGEGRLAYYRSRISKGPDTSLTRTRARVGKIIRPL